MDLTELYRYFAQFVPKEVLRKNYTAAASDTGEAAQVQTETLTDQSDLRLPSIGEYVFMGDSDFILQRLRNSQQQLLLVDSDRIDYQSDTDEGLTITMGVSVCEHYNRSNNDIVSELVVQNRCLHTLQQILLAMDTDAAQACPLRLQTSGKYEIRFLDAKAMNGLIGYTAFFTLKGGTYAD